MNDTPRGFADPAVQRQRRVDQRDHGIAGSQRNQDVADRKATRQIGLIIGWSGLAVESADLIADRHTGAA